VHHRSFKGSDPMKIAIAGLGYTAIGYAQVLARHHEVVVAGPMRARIHAVNTRHAVLNEAGEQDWLDSQALRLRATPDFAQALVGADMAIIATPLPQETPNTAPDLSEIEAQVALALMRVRGPVVLMSPVPLGTTARLCAEHGTDRLVHVPEMLREGQAREGVRLPQTLVIGHRGAAGAEVAQLLRAASDRPDAPVLQIGPTEAEAVKTLTDGYIAMRLGYFNELDSYALVHGLNAKQVIEGVCLDPRVGPHTNNPCFGIGGNRLPRAMAALENAFDSIPSSLASAIARANLTRSSFLAEQLLSTAPRQVGVLGVQGPTAGDPFNHLLNRIKATGCRILAHDPGAEDTLPGRAGAGSGPWADMCVTSRLDEIKSTCDVIISRRDSVDLADVREKVFCRDHFTTF
jgi:UDPglucose 6-dehydrogenase